MISRKLPFLCLMAAAVSMPAMLADEGRVPLYQQTVINAPGHYVVTRNFAVASGSAITIQASGVTIDLNKHTISGSGTAGSLISIGAGATDVIVKNGRLTAAERGIHSSAASSRARILVESLEINEMIGSAIFIDNADVVEVLRCTIANVARSLSLEAAIEISGPGGFGGRLTDNTIKFSIDKGMNLSGLSGGEVSRNTLLATGAALDNPGMVLSGGGGNLVEGNTIRQGSGIGLNIIENADIIRGNIVSRQDEGGIAVSGTGNQILENVSSGNGGFDIAAGGLSVGGDHNSIRGNQVSNNTGHGISVFGGPANIVEGNLSQGHFNAIYGDCGLYFGSANGHVYRNNVLRDNTGGAVCGSVNTDAGGNVL